MENKDISYRWSHGIPHNPKSIALYKKIVEVDMKNGDWFEWKHGGDGDDGETLMYILDIIFEGEESGK